MPILNPTAFTNHNVESQRYRRLDLYHRCPACCQTSASPPNCVSCATAVQTSASLAHLHLRRSSCSLLPGLAVGILAGARRLPGAHHSGSRWLGGARHGPEPAPCPPASRIAESLRRACCRIVGSRSASARFGAILSTLQLPRRGCHERRKAISNQSTRLHTRMCHHLISVHDNYLVA